LLNRHSHIGFVSKQAINSIGIYLSTTSSEHVVCRPISSCCHR